MTTWVCGGAGSWQLSGQTNTFLKQPVQTRDAAQRAKLLPRNAGLTFSKESREARTLLAYAPRATLSIEHLATGARRNPPSTWSFEDQL